MKLLFFLESAKGSNFQEMFQNKFRYVFIKSAGSHGVFFRFFFFLIFSCDISFHDDRIKNMQAKIWIKI